MCCDLTLWLLEASFKIKKKKKPKLLSRPFLCCAPCSLATSPCLPWKVWQAAGQVCIGRVAETACVIRCWRSLFASGFSFHICKFKKLGHIISQVTSMFQPSMIQQSLLNCCLHSFSTRAYVEPICV